MLSERECQQFRPLGQRLLVKRLALPEQSQGDIYVLGRDYPTLGRIVNLGGRSIGLGHVEINENLHEFAIGDEVQWSIKPDFDQRCVIGPDWLCLETDDINVRIDDRGIARAVGNRVLLTPTKSTGLLTRTSSIYTTEFQSTRWALGRVESRGFKAIDSLGHLDSLQVIYNPSLRSELYLNNKQYFVVRDEDCIAMIEE